MENKTQHQTFPGPFTELCLFVPGGWEAEHLDQHRKRSFRKGPRESNNKTSPKQVRPKALQIDLALLLSFRFEEGGPPLYQAFLRQALRPLACRLPFQSFALEPGVGREGVALLVESNRPAVEETWRPQTKTCPLGSALVDGNAFAIMFG